MYNRKKFHGTDISDYWIFTIPFLIVFLIFYGLFVPAFGTSYSKGQREGQLQKYSVKGLFWKTGEGELVLPNFQIRTSENGSKGGNEVFSFSDKECRSFDEAIGRNVRVYYTQALHLPYSDGETNYQVDSIVIIR